MTASAAERFRDYSTRIAFNLSLSRNMIGHLHAVVVEEQFANEHGSTGENKMLRIDHRSGACAEVGGKPQLFVQGLGSLERMGLIEMTKGMKKQEELFLAGAKGWTYHGPRYQLTEPGQLCVEMLRVVGLLPRLPANVPVKRKKKAA
jgi:hypothetical protein